MDKRTTSRTGYLRLNTQPGSLDEFIDGRVRHYGQCKDMPPQHRALADAFNDAVLDDTENWWRSFERNPNDVRGLNSALRGNSGEDIALPWGVVDKGLETVAPLFEADHPRWLTRMGFVGRCYATIADEVERRRKLPFQFPGFYKNAAPSAVSGLTLSVLSSYLAQTDRLEAEDILGRGARRQLVDDVMTGAVRLYDCFGHAMRIQNQGAVNGSSILAKRLFDDTVRRLEAKQFQPGE